MKHTPGPWHVEENSAGDFEVEPDICIVGTDEGNAHLIAASPDLLAGLQRLRIEIKQFKDMTDQIKYIDGLIAKANGDS